MMRTTLTTALATCLVLTGHCFGTGKPPQDVKSLWADFDPRKAPLDVKVVRQWKEGGTTFRYVTFHIGTFKGKKASLKGNRGLACIAGHISFRNANYRSLRYRRT